MLNQDAMQAGDGRCERGNKATGDQAVMPGRTRAPFETVTFVLPAIGAGGSEHVVAMLCNHFARQGVKVRLICFDKPGTPPFYSLEPSIELVCLGWEGRSRAIAAGPSAMWRRYRLLKSEFSRVRPDIVISFLTRTNVLAALAAHALGIPVIVSERNNPERQRVNFAWEWLRRRAYRRACALVTMTRGAGRYFTPAPQRIDRVIPNHAKVPERPTAWNVAGRRIVAVGRLVEQKGFDLLLRAFASIADDFPDWMLTIWGEGPLRSALEELCHQLNLDDRVTMPGTTGRPGEWTTDADLFVLSSRFEGWGLVVGEAMAAGIPTVSFDCPWGPADMIEDGRTGLLAPDQDVPALAQAMARAMADPDLRRRLGAAGREAMKRYAPELILAQWDVLLKEVAAARKTTGTRNDR